MVRTCRSQPACFPECFQKQASTSPRRCLNGDGAGHQGQSHKYLLHPLPLLHNRKVLPSAFLLSRLETSPPASLHLAASQPTTTSRPSVVARAWRQSGSDTVYSARSNPPSITE